MCFDFLYNFCLTHVASAGGELTTDAFPPVHVLWMCCRAGAMGVTIGVIVNATVESKQKNLLIRLPGVQTGLVGRLSRLRVSCQACVRELQTEHNHHTVTPKH